MAEFLNESSPKPDPVMADGFNEMGKPIPSYRRQAAYETCRSFGLDADSSWTTVSGMAEQLERDKPYEAMAAGMRKVDLTGAYRLMAVLLTAPKPRIVVTMAA